MLGLDTQYALAKSWNDSAAQWLAAWSGLTTDAMSQAITACAPAPSRHDSSPAKPAPQTVPTPSSRSTPSPASRSWYRPPVPNPLAASIFGLPFGGTAMGLWPMPALMSPDLMGAFQQPFQFWNAVLSASRFAFNPMFFNPAFAAGFIPNWAMWVQPQAWASAAAPLPAAAPQPAPLTPFAAYRSDSR